MSASARTIRWFLDDTNRRGSTARLRAALLDDAGPAARVMRPEIEAIVLAYELGIARTPASEWTELHQQIAAATDATSASAALDEWAHALDTSWRDQPGDVRATSKRLPPAILACTLVAVIVLGAIVVAVFSDNRDDSVASPSTTSAEAPTTSTTEPPGSVDPSLQEFFTVIDNEHCSQRGPTGLRLRAEEDPVKRDFGEGVVDLWRCFFDTGPGAPIVATFAMFESPAQAAEFVDRRTEASLNRLEGGPWTAGRKAGIYVVDGPGPTPTCLVAAVECEAGTYALAWNYTGRPFAGSANSDDYDTLIQWWSEPISAP